MRTGSTEDGGDCEGASCGLSFVLEWGKHRGDLVLFFFVGGRGVGLVVGLGDSALEICR